MQWHITLVVLGQASVFMMHLYAYVYSCARSLAELELFNLCVIEQMLTGEKKKAFKNILTPGITLKNKVVNWCKYICH